MYTGVRPERRYARSNHEGFRMAVALENDAEAAGLAETAWFYRGVEGSHPDIGH